MTAKENYVYEEEYYHSSGIPTERLPPLPIDYTVRLEATKQMHKLTDLFTTIMSDRYVSFWLLVAIGLIFKSYEYFLHHGTEAGALVAACVIGALIWATLGPSKA